MFNYEIKSILNNCFLKQAFKCKHCEQNFINHMTDLIAIKTHNVIKTETQRDVFIILNNNFSNVSIQVKSIRY